MNWEYGATLIFIRIKTPNNKKFKVQVQHIVSYGDYWITTVNSPEPISTAYTEAEIDEMITKIK